MGKGMRGYRDTRVPDPYAPQHGRIELITTPFSPCKDVVQSNVMERLIVTGNATTEASHRNGWFVGQFMDASEPLRAARDVEVKWGAHAKDEARETWSLNKSSTTLTVLVSGTISHEFPENTVVLSETGDYVIWAPGVPHRWNAVEPSVSISVRWPSVPDDTVELSNGVRPGRFEMTGALPVGDDRK